MTNEPKSPNGAPCSRRDFIASTANVAGGLGITALTAASAMPAYTQAPTQEAAGYFPGFKKGRVKLTHAEIDYVIGGSGPPLLLLHGWPQTKVTWHKVAPMLADSFRVVAADLRGYGDSSKPASTPDHEPYSKRAMARDQVELMNSLGFSRFAVVGHDRGGRVAHRMSIDYPDTVSKLAVLDIVPGAEVYEATDRTLATGYYHWFFLIQPAPMPEKLIAGDVDAFLKWGMSRLMPKIIEPAAFAEYLRCLSTPAAIHGMCEDYRAGATIDLAHDAADNGRKVGCPTLVIWGGRGLVAKKFDLQSIWARYAANPTYKMYDCNHWIPEEVPNELVTDLKAFLRA